MGNISDKTALSDIPKRYDIKESKTEGILLYDADNSYPQRMKRLVSSSVTASASVGLYKKFNNGKGFEDIELGKSMLNSKETANAVLKQVSNDFSDFGGIALHFNYNALLEISSIKAVPFEFCRLTLPESENSGRIAVYEDWANEMSKKVDKDKIVYVDEFTENKAEIAKQIEKAGGFGAWKGHILYWSSNPRGYPLTAYDPAAKDIETDAEVSRFKLNNILTGFLASHFMFLKQEFEDDNDRAQYVARLSEFQGGENAGKFMLIDGVNEDNKPEIEKIDVANNDRLFEYTETSVKNNIRQSLLAPRELIGEEFSSGFNTEQIDQSRSYYNSITEPNRDGFSELFDIFLPKFHLPLSKNTKIKPLYVEEPVN